MSCHCDDAFSRSPSALSLNRLAAAAAFSPAAAASAASLSLVLSLAARSVSVAVFALSEISSNCALKPLSAIKHSFINWDGHAPTVVTVGRADRLKSIFCAHGLPGHCLLGHDRRRLTGRRDNRSALGLPCRLRCRLPLRRPSRFPQMCRAVSSVQAN